MRTVVLRATTRVVLCGKCYNGFVKKHTDKKFFGNPEHVLGGCFVCDDPFNNLSYKFHYTYTVDDSVES